MADPMEKLIARIDALEHTAATAHALAVQASIGQDELRALKAVTDKLHVEDLHLLKELNVLHDQNTVQAAQLAAAAPVVASLKNSHTMLRIDKDTGLPLVLGQLAGHLCDAAKEDKTAILDAVRRQLEGPLLELSKALAAVTAMAANTCAASCKTLTDASTFFAHGEGAIGSDADAAVRKLLRGGI